MKLNEKIKNKSAKVGVIGLGYVGLPLAIEFAKSGFDVIGIDIDVSKINLINDGKNYIKDIDNNTFKEVIESKKFCATSDYSTVIELDSIFYFF